MPIWEELKAIEQSYLSVQFANLLLAELICVYIVRSFLPFALFNLRPFGVASFFPGGPLDVHRAFSPLLQPLARSDWRWGFRLK